MRDDFRSAPRKRLQAVMSYQASRPWATARRVQGVENDENEARQNKRDCGWALYWLRSDGRRAEPVKRRAFRVGDRSGYVLWSDDRRQRDSTRSEFDRRRTTHRTSQSRRRARAKSWSSQRIARFGSQLP